MPTSYPPPSQQPPPSYLSPGSPGPGPNTYQSIPVTGDYNTGHPTYGGGNNAPPPPRYRPPAPDSALARGWPHSTLDRALFDSLQWDSQAELTRAYKSRDTIADRVRRSGADQAYIPPTYAPPIRPVIFGMPMRKGERLLMGLIFVLIACIIGIAIGYYFIVRNGYQWDPRTDGYYWYWWWKWPLWLILGAFLIICGLAFKLNQASNRWKTFVADMYVYERSRIRDRQQPSYYQGNMFS